MWSKAFFPALSVVVVGCSYSPDSASPCGSATVRTSGTSQDVTLSDQPVAAQKCELDGVLQHQILGEPVDGEGIQEVSAFSLLLVDDERQTDGYHDFFSAIDTCWREVDDFALRGEREVWDELDFSVGDDDLTLRRRKGWAPGQTFYVRDPPNSDALGRKSGAELALERSALGIAVPKPFTWDMQSWDDFLDTAVLDARWTPADDDAVVFLHLWVYDLDLERERFTCTLADDGHAVIDIGWAAGDLRSAELSIGRMTHNIADVDDIGTIDSAVYRHLRLVAYDLRP